MKVVFDTSTYIAALITEGLISKILKRARRKEFTLVICPFILEEINIVLSEKFKLSKKDVSSAILLINEATS